MNSNAKLFDRPEVGERYLSHYTTLRGKVREEIVHRHLSEVVLATATAPLTVVDIGCGDGRDARWLATMGHDVLAVDPSSEMIKRSKDSLTELDIERLPTFLLGDAATVLDRCGESSFDLVLSHGVVMYQDDPATFVAEQIRLLRPKGFLSLLAKNAEGLVYRAVKEASVDEAIRALDDSSGSGHLGVSTGAQTMQELADIGFSAGVSVRSWAGVRMFSDTRIDDLAGDDDNKVIELEWRAALRDPYRKTAALLHVLMLKGIDLSLLPD